MIEERLHQVEIAPEDAAEAVHALEHAPEHAHAPPHLTGAEPVPERAGLLGEVARHGAEQRVLTVGVAVDAVARRRRIVDRHERQLGNAERGHGDVDGQHGIAIVAPRAQLHARPRSLVRRRDAQGPLPRPVE